ncbi:MAG: amino acid--tRNA ligase-related protein [Patescibacteria group bacterium]|jgi:lysyl-tRNA synthetase class 2
MNNVQSLIVREEIIKTIRSFFYKQNFHEVIPDILNDTLPSEPNLFPFSTVWKTQESEKTYFLPMSPERSIKKMLAQDIGNCFAISKSFRNLEGSGSLHKPEFLMLEWYRENAVYTDIMSDVEKLFVNFGFKKNWPVLSLKKLFQKYLDLDLEKTITNNKLFFKDYDQLFVNEIESKLPKTPLFLIDFPSKISPLCKPQKNNPVFAERFECYISGIELGNGNTENTDAKSLRKIFKREQRLTSLPIDEEFLDSLKTMSKKSYAGVGIGIERLVMVLNNRSSIITS